MPEESTMHKALPGSIQWPPMVECSASAIAQIVAADHITAKMRESAIHFQHSTKAYAVVISFERLEATAMYEALANSIRWAPLLERAFCSAERSVQAVGAAADRKKASRVMDGTVRVAACHYSHQEHDMLHCPTAENV